MGESGNYPGALSRFQAALALHPASATLHELKAQVALLLLHCSFPWCRWVQVLLELGRDFEAVKAGEAASSLAPLWAEAWLTLGRAQRNFGELAIVRMLLPFAGRG